MKRESAATTGSIDPSDLIQREQGEATATSSTASNRNGIVEERPTSLPPLPSITSVEGRVGVGQDGAQLYSTSFVHSHAGVIWHHRGGGRWAQGLPQGLTGNLKQTQIRIPTLVKTMASGEHLINRRHGSYGTITADQIDQVFADRNNIQKAAPRGLPGRPAHIVPGTRVAMISRIEDDDDYGGDSTSKD